MSTMEHKETHHKTAIIIFFLCYFMFLNKFINFWHAIFESDNSLTMNTSGNGSDSLKELKDYVFMTYFRKKKTKHLVEMLFSGYQLFVPITVSLPLTLHRKDICI